MLALDVDGTLVGPDMALSGRLVAAIARAVRRGVKVSLATGRMPSSAVVFANRLGLEEPIIGHQGAIVRAMPGPGRRRPTRGPVPRPDRADPVPPAAGADVMVDAVRWCYANGLHPHINAVERMIVAEDDPNFADYSAYLGRDAETVRDLTTDIRARASKVIAVGEPGLAMALIEEARRVFAGRASPTVSHPRFLEFVAPGVSKGRAVAWLAHRAGIPMGQVLAMGDALNDFEMISDAGHGAGVASGPAEVQLAGRYIAQAVEQDGAAALIEALVLAPQAEARRNAERLAEAAAVGRPTCAPPWPRAAEARVRCGERAPAGRRSSPTVRPPGSSPPSTCARAGSSPSPPTPCTGLRPGSTCRTPSSACSPQSAAHRRRRLPCCWRTSSRHGRWGSGPPRRRLSASGSGRAA